MDELREPERARGAERVSERPAPERRAERGLLPLVLAYVPVPVVGAILSVVWDVGATPGRTAVDLPLRGSPLAPPLFLPVLLVAAAMGARRPGLAGSVCTGLCGLVGAAFLAGSTLNLPTDLATARAAGTPVPLTMVLAIIHAGLALALLWRSVPPLVGRIRAAEAGRAVGRTGGRAAQGVAG